MIARVVLLAGCYALALVQRPGVAVADTKIDLHVDPVGFLAGVAAVWSPSTSLGHVQSGQYGGYLFPMGPFYALGHLAGLAPWLVQRLWLGTLYALAAWGVVRLLDKLLDRRRGVAHWIAAGAYVLNPYVLTYTSRVSVTLLAYAALPWLLVCVHRGLRDERRWAWPAIAALIVTASGGGVNAAVTAFVLLGPLLLLVYEPALGMAPWAAARGFAWRAALLGLVCSLWWVLPLVVQAAYGLPFLQYTEQAGTIWDTTSLSESLRGMGFWLSYAGVGYGGRLVPYTSDAHVLVFAAPVLVATLLVPALALGGFAWTRRWRFGPFFLALALLGALVMFAGFPEGTPLRDALTWAYNRAGLVQFLRTTYKAGPLLALGVAVLLGAAARSRPAPVAALIAVLLVAGSWPLWRGRAVDDQLAFDRVPAAWSAAADDLDARLGDNARAMVLPGQLFAHYRWGGTVDPILPALTDRPVAVRAVVPFADLRSVDLQWATDALIAQQRALPGQLGELLGLQGVGEVISGTDDDRARSGALGAADAARELAGQALRAPDRAWGPVRRVPAAAGSLDPPLALPQVRRYNVRGGAGLVQVLPRDGGVVVDGSADGVAELAAFGTRLADAPLRYAADLSADDLRRAARRGATVVISDSNRRRVFVPSKRRGNAGATLAAWPDRGTDAQTVAVLRGVRYARSPFSPQLTQFPEHRPFAALDGDPRTAWLADRALDADRWHLDVGLLRRRDVPYLDLLPYGDERGRVKAVKLNGRRFRVHEGWNRLPVRLRDADRVSVAMVDVTNPPGGETGGAGGIRELRIPGVRVDEALRPPVLAERALRGTRAPLEYLFSRTRGDDPSHRGRPTGPWQAGLVRDQGDAEAGLERLFSPPAASGWTPDAWVSVAPGAPDDALDRLAGVRSSVTSSSRYEGLPARRGSRAFDGDPRTAWIADWPGAWLAWRTQAPRTVRSLRLVAGPVRRARSGSVPERARVRRPTRVRLVVDGRPGPALAVADDGVVRPPAPVRGRAFRLEILDARFAAGTSGRERQRRAVGIAEVRGAGLRVRRPRTGAIAAGCAVRFAAGRKVFRLHPEGTLRALDAGTPLRARPCGAPVALGAGETRLSAPPGRVFRIDELRLRSPGAAAAPATPARSGAPRPTRSLPPRVADAISRQLRTPEGRRRLEARVTLELERRLPRRVLDAGTPGRGRRDDARVRAREPSWLVLGESYNRGWRARCDGRDLGKPVPLQGYANGWPLDRSCRALDFAFAPQRLALAGYVLSALAVLALLLMLALRRPRRVAGGAALALEPAPEPAPWPWRRALAAGAVAAAAGGFVFALRAGVVIGPLVVAILRLGIGPRRLALGAGTLLAAVVPILYLAIPVTDHGGYGTAVPIDRLAAHWVAVAAVVLLLAALARELRWRRARSGPAAAAPGPAPRTPPHTARPGPAPRTRPARTSPS